MFARASAIVILCAAVVVAAPQAPRPERLPGALEQMIAAEREFAARALEVGWKLAFLEYFAPDAIGFDRGQVGLAREQILRVPDPPPDLQLIWEPRYGDVAGSGELGYLTGPVRRLQASHDKGRPRHSNYLSVWKRQRDGSFKVVMDVGVDTPGPVPFPDGFTRAAHANRFTGDYDDSTPPLGTADSLLNAGLRANQSRAYRPLLTSATRFHRPNLMPVVGDRRILQWLASQTALASADHRYAEVARSGDLGYTWGSYSARPVKRKAQGGFYVRVWARERDGQWKLALDVLQPQN